MRSYIGLLEPRGSNLTSWTPHISYAGCQSHFNRKSTSSRLQVGFGKSQVGFTKKVTPRSALESSSEVLVMISSKSVSICNRFHARWANSGKITISKGGGTPLWCPRSRGISSPSGTKITSLETRDSRLSHSEDFMILSCVVLTQYSSVTDRRTDRQTDGQKDASAVAKTRYSITCCRA